MNESQRIAAEVGAAAVRALTPLDYLPVYVALIARGSGDRDELAELIESTRDELAECLDDLAGRLDGAAGWWIADRPPAFDPGATSAAEAVLRAGARVLAWLDGPGLEELTARCRLAAMNLPEYDPASADVIEAAIVCEVAEMTRRPAPTAESRALWEAVYPEGVTLRRGRECISSARIRLGAHLPSGWARMGQSQRAAVVEGQWAARLPAMAPALVLRQRRPTARRTPASLEARVRELRDKEHKTLKEISAIVRREFGEKKTPEALRKIYSRAK